MNVYQYHFYVSREALFSYCLLQIVILSSIHRWLNHHPGAHW